MRAGARAGWLSQPRALVWAYVIGGGAYPLWRAWAPAGALDPAWLWWVVGATFVCAGLGALRRRDDKPSRLLFVPSFAAALHLHGLFVVNAGELFYALAAATNVVTVLLVLPGTFVLIAYSVVVVTAAIAWFALGHDTGSVLYWVSMAWFLALASRWLLRQRLAVAYRHELAIRLAEERARSMQLQEELFLAQRMESLGRLAGGLAHEFNNQLMAVRIHAELMEQHAPPALGPDLQRIKRALDQAAELTTQLQHSLRPRALRTETVDLDALLQDQFTMLRHLLGEGITLVCPPYEPCCVPMSRDRAEQVILNLVLNARDAMLDGGTLTISLRKSKPDEVELPAHFEGSAAEAFVQLAISDTGVGIDSDTRARIFDPFFTTKADRGRNGLGLSAVYGIVADSGGHVRVVSEPGKGARFELYWPLAEVEPTAFVAAPAAEPGRERLARILLVEDQRELRHGLAQWLEGSGHSVIEASTGEQALACLEASGQAVDLVATDVVLPGMDGIELIERLRRRAPGLPALAFTGHLDHLSRTGRHLPQGVPLLDKPFDPQRLNELIARLVAANDPGACRREA